MAKPSKARMPNRKPPRRRDPDRPAGPTHMEPFRCVNVQVAAIVPPDEDFPHIEVAQVCLILVGQPAHLTGEAGVKRYMTFFDAPTAIGVAGALNDEGETVRDAGKKLAGESPGGIILGQDVASAAAEAEQAAERERSLRKGTPAA